LSTVKYKAGNNRATSAFVGGFNLLKYFILFEFNVNYSIIKVRDYFSPWYTRIEPNVPMKYILVKNQDIPGLSNGLNSDTIIIIVVNTIIKIISNSAVFFIVYYLRIK
jgi:hypothetical protein